MIITSPAVQLTVHCETLPDSPAAHVLVRDLPARAARLRTWGRFSRALRLHITPNTETLHRHAPRPSVLDLRGLAWGDDVWLLDPAAWPLPPSDLDWVNLVTHEIAHVLWFQRTVSAGSQPAYTPTWFREGFAVIASEGPPSPAGRRALCDERIAEAAFADDAGIADLGGVCYQIGAQLFWQWWQERQARGWSALCRELRAGRSFSQAFAQVSGTSDREFVAAQAAAWVAEARRT